MLEQRYAVYVEGRDEPIGTLRKSTLGAIGELSQATGKNYRTEPVSQERATEIRDSVTRFGH